MAKDEAGVSDLDAKNDAMFEAQRQIADRAWYEHDQLAKAYAARWGAEQGRLELALSAALVLRHQRDAGGRTDTMKRLLTIGLLAVLALGAAALSFDEARAQSPGPTDPQPEWIGAMRTCKGDVSERHDPATGRQPHGFRARIYVECHFPEIRPTEDFHTAQPHRHGRTLNWGIKLHLHGCDGNNVWGYRATLRRVEDWTGRREVSIIPGFEPFIFNYVSWKESGRGAARQVSFTGTIETDNYRRFTLCGDGEHELIWPVEHWRKTGAEPGTGQLMHERVGTFYIRVPITFAVLPRNPSPAPATTPTPDVQQPEQSDTIRQLRDEIITLKTERDRYLNLWTDAALDRDMARAERDTALAERDEARAERDARPPTFPAPIALRLVWAGGGFALETLDEGLDDWRHVFTWDIEANCDLSEPPTATCERIDMAVR